MITIFEEFRNSCNVAEFDLELHHRVEVGFPKTKSHVTIFSFQSGQLHVRLSHNSEIPIKTI